MRRVVGLGFDPRQEVMHGAHVALRILDGISRTHQRCDSACARLRADVAAAEHATSTTLPAVLALGEHTSASGLDIIAALIRGVEAQGRLRVASRQYEPRDLMFHPPGMVGVIGSAVGSAYLLGLDVERIRHAIASAASRATSLMGRNIGSLLLSLRPGRCRG